jgi:glutathione peroxidase
MNKIVFCISFLFCLLLLETQTATSNDLLFPQYEEGTAILKNGTKAPGRYNYSTIKRQFQYLEKEGTVMTFEHPADISAVVIAGRTFENTPKNGFLERVSVGDGFYYVEWGAKWISIGRRTGMGEYRAQSYSSTNYKTSDAGNSAVPLYNYDEGMGTIPECSFFLKVNDKLKRFDSASSLAKAIGCCKKELNEFVKKENINFKNPEDVHRMMMIFLAGAAQEPSIYGFTVKTIADEDFSLSSLKGKKVMIVNVASKCGLTPQYAQLQELYEKYKNSNFVIIGFPANNFGAQEPGSNEEIQEFCTLNYGVTFPMMAKISVKGDDIAPLYRWLTTKAENGVADAEVGWNFQKFLIDEQGRWVKSIAPGDSPKSEEIITWIEGI